MTVFLALVGDKDGEDTDAESKAGEVKVGLRRADRKGIPGEELRGIRLVATVRCSIGFSALSAELSSAFVLTRKSSDELDDLTRRLCCNYWSAKHSERTLIYTTFSRKSRFKSLRKAIKPLSVAGFNETTQVIREIFNLINTIPFCTKLFTYVQ